MKVCLNQVTTGGGLKLPEFVKLAADAGFEGADVDLGYAVGESVSALRDLFGRSKLAFGGWGVPDWRGDEAAFRTGLTTLGKQAAAAKELGIDSACTWIMPSSPQPFQATWQFHVVRLREVARVLADSGLRLGLEFVSPYHIRIMSGHEFVFTPGQMLELAHECGGNVGLLMDCWHLHAAGVPVSYLSRIEPGKIVHVHINDAPNCVITDLNDGRRLLPGEGVIDQSAFRIGLAAIGYTGPVSLEVFGRLKDVPHVEAARVAASACRGAGWM
jgi:sugar phosphate isomerase/epimerase